MRLKRYISNQLNKKSHVLESIHLHNADCRILQVNYWLTWISGIPPWGFNCYWSSCALC